MSGRRAEVDNQLNGLQEQVNELWTYHESLEGRHGALKRKVDWATKGSYLVVEGSESAEKLRSETVGSGSEGGGWNAFKAGLPKALAGELACLA